MEELEGYAKVGRALALILSKWSSAIREGDSLLHVAEEIEGEIRGLGFKPAFPVNLSLNEIAAHYTPPPEDCSVVQEGSLLKLDVGVEFEGYIADAARSVYFDDRHERMVEVARQAFEAATKLMRPGTRIREVSKAIYETIKSEGFIPIRNLAGHKITKYKLHSGVDIPNSPTLSFYKIKEGDVFAIEPFVTDRECSGLVKDEKIAYIFSFKRSVRTSSSLEKRILRIAAKDFHGLPFCARWLISSVSRKGLDRALSGLVRKGGIYAYPVLVEVNSCTVAQYENTVFVTNNGPVVLTEL